MNQKRKISFQLISLRNIPVYLLITYYIVIMAIFMGQDQTTKAEAGSVFGFLFILLAVSALTIFDISKIKNFMKKWARWINGFVLLITPVVSFIMAETMVSNFNMKMYKEYSLYNIIWYIIIYYLIFALIRDARLTIIIGNLLIYLAATVNYLVYLFRGNPILPSDLLAWRTGMSVADNYTVSFTKGFMIASLIMIIVCLVAYKLEKADYKPSIVNRIAVIGTFVVFACVIFHLFFDTDLIKTKIRVIDFFAPKYTYADYGTAFGFVANVKAMDTVEPEGYSTEKVEQALEAAPKQITGASSEAEKPNIIVIMNEAFSDLSLIGNYTTNMDYLPNIRALSENTIKGRLFVSVYGGATSDTEYEFLTGNSMAVMPANSVPYQQFVTKPTDSLARTLKAQGYYNIAIHPYKPSGYKRDLVYPLLGFDEFLSMEDFENPKLIRSYISDSSDYQKIIEQYETKKDQGPLFIFNVTMQNHGGYSSSQIFSDEDTVRLTYFPNYNSTEQYLSLLRQSDMAFQELIDYFTQQSEHTIILLFGDHQPIVYSYFHEALASQPDAVLKKYQVPFVLWANYDIPEEDVEQISANYLSSLLLKTAGLEGTRYNDYLMSLYQKVPVITALFYIDKDGQSHDFSEETPYSDLITEYKYVGYNNALDKKNKLDQYFYLN